MPVRSLGSSLLSWPGREEVDRAVRAWAARLAAREPDLVAVGYFGSYARGQAGPGSDVDLVVILRSCADPPARRAVRWDLERLPVPAEAVVYTLDEWRRLPEVSPRFCRVLADAVWVWGSPPGTPASGARPDADDPDEPADRGKP
jgi:predicted nucleotidyltransferase